MVLISFFLENIIVPVIIRSCCIIVVAVSAAKEISDNNSFVLFSCCGIYRATGAEECLPGIVDSIFLGMSFLGFTFFENTFQFFGNCGSFAGFANGTGNIIASINIPD